LTVDPSWKNPDLMAGPTNTRRVWLHLLMGIPAFLLVCLDWRVALLLAFVAFLVNTEVLPRSGWGGALMRRNEKLGGVAWYPFSVLILILMFREETLPTACGWVSMSFGDALAGTLGCRIPLKSLPWNVEKSWGGFLGFVAGATIALVLVRLQHGQCDNVLLWSLLTGLVGAVFESLPVKIDDNLRVPLGTGIFSALLPGVG